MAHIRNIKHWKTLCWNIRGINSVNKWDSVRDKIVESGCDIICPQETKRETFDIQYIKKICSPAFDVFEFLPSVGATGGITTIRKSALFEGHLAFHNSFSIYVDFHSLHSNAEWLLTNVYGPCTDEVKHNFVD